MMGAEPIAKWDYLDEIVSEYLTNQKGKKHENPKD